MHNMENLKTVMNFFKAIEDNTIAERASEFYHPEIIQIEYPNAITKQTAFRNLGQLTEAAVRGRKLIKQQTLKIEKSYCLGDTVIIEALWTGILAVPSENKESCPEMTANFAQVFDFEDGKIIRQRNYDCFQPFN
jgi:ketosteroid isomerase-like protein